ncbi:hypothetical protein HDU76_008621 [Blyttiomyces sp. JEL0837]|nr:hypothetical protein HDU76_008621 [Blyttiomyces sp. JEL0837]
MLATPMLPLLLVATLAPLIHAQVLGVQLHLSQDSSLCFILGTRAGGRAALASCNAQFSYMSSFFTLVNATSTDSSLIQAGNGGLCLSNQKGNAGAPFVGKVCSKDDQSQRFSVTPTSSTCFHIAVSGSSVCVGYVDQNLIETACDSPQVANLCTSPETQTWPTRTDILAQVPSKVNIYQFTSFRNCIISGSTEGGQATMMFCIPPPNGPNPISNFTLVPTTRILNMPPASLISYMIKDVETGTCLGAIGKDPSMTPSEAVRSWKCDSTCPRQYWYAKMKEPQDPGRCVTFQNAYTQTCMGVNEKDVVHVPCSNEPTQLFCADPAYWPGML